jgi:hypothetical protein
VGCWDAGERSSAHRAASRGQASVVAMRCPSVTRVPKEKEVQQVTELDDPPAVRGWAAVTNPSKDSTQFSCSDVDAGGIQDQGRGRTLTLRCWRAASKDGRTEPRGTPRAGNGSGALRPIRLERSSVGTCF